MKEETMWFGSGRRRGSDDCDCGEAEKFED